MGWLFSGSALFTPQLRVINGNLTAGSINKRGGGNLSVVQYESFIAEFIRGLGKEAFPSPSRPLPNNTYIGIIYYLNHSSAPRGTL